IEGEDAEGDEGEASECINDSYEGTNETALKMKQKARHNIRSRRATMRLKGAVMIEDLDSGAWWDPTEPIYYDYDEVIGSIYNSILFSNGYVNCHILSHKIRQMFISAKKIAEYDPPSVNILSRAIDVIEQNTCFKFARKTSPGPKILFVG